MAYKLPIDHKVYIDRNFGLYLLSQGISSLGDTFQLIAVTSLLINITGSGISATFGLICTPVLSIFFSAAAGFISDIKSDKFMLVLLDLLRGITAFAFISKCNIYEVYLLVIVMSLLDIFYNPPRRKFFAEILKSRHIMTGNSLLNGLIGGMYLVGPVVAGLAVSKYGTNIAFFINSISYFMSAFCISITRYKAKKIGIKRKSRSSGNLKFYALLNVIKYCMNTYILRKVILTGTVICFVTTSMNIAFYPFAFDILNISDQLWGLMMSIFYGAGLLAMPISLMFNFNIKTYYKLIIPSLMSVISIIWLLYGCTSRLKYILLLQLLEGMVLAFINIVLTSHLQIKADKEILGSVIGVNDFINNAGKIFGIICTYALLKSYSITIIFFSCSIIISVYSIYTIASINGNKLKQV